MLSLVEVRAATLAKLQASGLTVADVHKLKLVAMTADQCLALQLPAAAAGFQIPYFSVTGKPTKFFRYRYLEETRKGFDVLSGKKPLRYGQPANSTTEVYLPPYVKWPDVFGNPEQYLIITEGELKAVSASKAGLPTMGLGGVWCFQSTRHKQPLLPLLTQIEWQDRPVYICYDSDGADNADVARAEGTLAKRLMNLGAKVHLCRLPPTEEGGKVGLDDYLVAHGADQFQVEILATAKEYSACEALHDLNSKVVYVRNPGLVYSYEHNMKMTPAMFVQHSYANLSFFETTYTADGKEKMVSKPTADTWIKWPCRAELAGLTYAPGQPPVTEDRCLNTWSGWGVRNAVRGDVGPWRELLDHLFGANKEARTWFERWCAYPIQHPGVKMASAAALWGVVHGSGKTMIGHILMKLYGSNGTEIHDAELTDVRYEWAENKQFVLADDITGDENRTVTRKFMTMITQKLMRLNIKFLPSYTVPDCINYYFTANAPDMFYLDDGDRRFFIWEVTADKLPVELRNRIIKWRNSKEGQEALMYYLMHLPLGDFDPQAEAMQTEAKREMTLMGKSIMGAWVARLKEAPEPMLNGKLRGDLFTAEELYSMFDPLGDKRSSPNALARELKRAGFKRPLDHGMLATEQGARRVYAIRNAEKWQKANRKDATQHYNEHHAIIKPKF